jgi:hypothetical protein
MGLDKNRYCITGSLILGLFIASCVQETKKQHVEFFVDAKGVENVNSISVRGSLPPLSWNQNYELKDEDNDSIYTGSIVFDIPYDVVEIKFVKNEDQFELNDLPNRNLHFDDNQDTKYKVKFDVMK